MTPDEWDACTEPLKMLSFLQESGRASERKLRLFAGRSWPEANTAAGLRVGPG
jgi:hypothetical protein